MKGITTSIFILLITFAGGCQKGTKDPSPAEQMKSILQSGAWKVQTVTVDGVDKTSTYAGLTIAFSATGFTTTNGHVVWPASGTWQFSDDTGKNIVRDDALPIVIGDATPSKLILQLTWGKTTFGRTESVKGVHVFTFGK